MEAYRSRYIAARRVLQRRQTREMNSEHVNHLSKQVKEYKRLLKREIMKAKREQWKMTFEKLEEDIWGQVYKINTSVSKNKPLPYAIPDEEIKTTLQMLFPEATHPFRERTAEHPPPEKFTQEELSRAVVSLKTRKTPGLEGFTTELVKSTYETMPDAFLDLYNEYMTKDEFPNN